MLIYIFDSINFIILRNFQSRDKENEHMTNDWIIRYNSGKSQKSFIDISKA